ncbi:MAG: dTMP kinase [Clostridiales Family XIII bacterium]|nr:dTMP kinase [Clostridiales Family XIII bacterium]
MFITFEGGDGSGKSTQIELLKSRFDALGQPALVTREPGGTPIGEKIRGLLLDIGCAEMDAVTEMMLYAAARAQLAAEVVRPALLCGRVVICDRWLDSSLVYQGAARGLGQGVDTVNAFATGGLTPDLTILLDIDPAEGLARAGKGEGPDRIESEGMEWHRQVRAAYLELAGRNPGRVRTLDAALPAEDIAGRIWAFVQAVWTPAGEGARKQ